MNQEDKIYFENAPIKEAVCTFTFKDKTSIYDLESIVNKLLSKSNYDSKEIKNVVTIQMAPKIEATEERLYSLKNKEGDKRIQLQPNGFSIHKLGRYSKWSDFSTQVFEAINLIKSDYKNGLINISLKKINSITLDNKLSPRTYFNYFPEYTNNDSFFKDGFNLLFNKKIKDNSQIFLRINNKSIGDKQNIIIDLWCTINATKNNLYLDDKNKIKELLYFHNNEMYKAFLSVLKQEGINLIK